MAYLLIPPERRYRPLSGSECVAIVLAALALLAGVVLSRLVRERPAVDEAQSEEVRP